MFNVIDVFSLKMILKESKRGFLKFKQEIICCVIVHFVGYFIKNCHLMHGYP
jgi:hypothetical protein